MRRLLCIGSSVVVALVLGAGSAWWVAESGAKSTIQNGPWRYNPLVGSVSADPYLRAQIARAGLLALNNSEAIYFFAIHDSAGNALRCDHTYRIEGHDVDARWWSITAYASDNFLIPNDQGRYSYNMSNLQRNSDGGYTIYLSCSPPPLSYQASGNWIPTGPAGAGDTFGLWLRMYNPAPSVLEQLDTIELPRIIREDTAGD